MISGETVFGILPIKKNSERVPGKNFRLLDGVPLWHYAARALANSGVVDKIIINTDTPEMVFETFCGVPFIVARRDPSICGDTVPMNEVIASVVEDYPADRYIQTHATSPFLTSATIAKALSTADADSMYSVTEHRSRFWLSEGAPVNHLPSELIPTQDLLAFYEENSAFYIFTRDAFLASGRRICGRTEHFHLSPIEAVDIDNESDWELAELLKKGQKVRDGEKT